MAHAVAFSSVQTRNSLPDTIWLGTRARPVPAFLAAKDVIPVELEALPANYRPSIVFLPTLFEEAGQQIQDARQQVGENVYLVAVIEKGITPAWTGRLLDLGADDVIAHDESQIQIAYHRALAQTKVRRKAADTLAETKLELQFMQSCFDELPAPLFFKNRIGQYSGFNNAFLHMIGMDAATVLGKTALELFPPELAKRYHEADAELMDEGGTQIYEGQVKFSDNTVRHVCFNKAVIHGDDGSTQGLAGAVLDISDRKAWEMAMQDLAERDPLTGAHNRRKFLDVAKASFDEAIKTGCPAAAAVLDIDHFKSINDQYGHMAGDQVLCALAALLGTSFEEPDCAARAGGEEFYILLCNTDKDQARLRLRKLLDDVSKTCVETEAGTISVTVSIGLSVRQEGDLSIEQVISRADEALYKAKDSGRNRVIVAH